MTNFDPEKYKIFECITGSRLYGTYTPDSDYDYRGICIPPLEVLLDPFMGFDQKDSGFEEADKTIYALGKFFKLCADSNPNIIELLFTPEKNILYKTKAWDNIIENKNFFISKKAKHTFLGYAWTQINKVKTHREWFLNPPKEKPTRKMFGLTDTPTISGEGLQAVSNIKFNLFIESFRDEIKRELEYRDAKKKWDNYYSWVKNRNPQRKLLEEKFGYDCKYILHVFRLLEEGKQLLLNGKIEFPLQNAKELLEIKNGKYTYDEAIEKVSNIEKEFEYLYESSKIPFRADKKALTKIYFDVINIS